MKKNIFAIFALAAAMVACDPENKETPVNNWTGSELYGDVTDAVSLNASTAYTLTEPVYVKEGGELTIPAGTKIKANAGDNFIIVEMGGKIFINGTAAAPVVMTSAAASPKEGDWGGLIINGRSPLAGGETNVDTEIDPNVKYGGSNKADNSGSVTYLVLAYTGFSQNADIEHNGLTLNAVGSGTTINNIYVPNGADDGIEFFGGFVNVDKLLVVNSNDDMFDFTRGYAGKLSNAYGVWLAGYSTGESDPSGVEADGNFDGNTPTDAAQSNFTIENVTFDLRQGTSDNLQNVLRVRRGATATIINALAKGNGNVDNVVNLDDGKGGANAASSISLTNSLTGTVTTVYKAPNAGNANKFGDFSSKTEADYIKAGNDGCATANFAWIANAGNFGFSF